MVAGTSLATAALRQASARGDLATVEQLIQNGADVNARNNPYDSPLYAASKEGHVAVVELLLQNGANINAQDWCYASALQLASKEGHVAVVKLLLQNGADVNAQGGHCGNALRAASKEGHVAVVKLLLQNGADVNAQGGHCGNALRAASVEGHVAVVKLLLQNGADANTHGGLYGNALQAASVEGHVAVVELLLQYGAKGHIEDNFFKFVLTARDGLMATRLEKEMAISSVALQDYWGIVRHLVTEGYDPNYGKSFMERPLAVAISHANLEEAEFLMRNYAIRDLGDQFYPLRDAILRRNVQEAQTILTRPRSLSPPKVETKRQSLQRHFHEAHKIFLTGSQSTGAGQEYKELAREMNSHKRMWRIGMIGVRRLIKNRSPKNLQQVIGILCVASAMRKSIQSEDTFGNHDLFLEDMDRWRELAVRPQQRRLFDEIVFAVWGKIQNSTGTPDTLDSQEEDRNILFEAVRNMVQRFATESSLPLAQLEHENFWEYYESSEKTSVALYESRGSYNDNCGGPNDPQISSSPDLRAARDDHLSGDDPAKGCDWDPGPKSLVPALLMIGAIFACILHYLLALHSGHVFLASSRSLSTYLETSYKEFVFQTLAASPAAEIESDLRIATTSTITILEGWALHDRCELIKSFLSCTGGWVPLTPAPFTGGSSDAFVLDPASNSLSATTPSPNTLDSSSTSTTPKSSDLSSSSTSTTSRHTCRICSKVLSTTGNLNRHLKKHQKLRKHSCQNAPHGCRYSDIRKDNVEKHEIKHCKWRRYVLTHQSP